MALCDACFSFYIKTFQIFRIIKLPWRKFVFFIHLWNLKKIQSSLWRMTIFSFFLFRCYCYLFANFEFAGFAPKQKYMGLTIHPWVAMASYLAVKKCNAKGIEFKGTFSLNTLIRLILYLSRYSNIWRSVCCRIIPWHSIGCLEK